MSEVGHIVHTLDRLGRQRGERPADMAIAIALTLFYLETKETNAERAEALFLSRVMDVCDVVDDSLVWRTPH